MGVSTDVTNQNVKVYLKDLTSEVKVTLNQLFPSSPIEYLLWENNGGDEARDSKLRPLQAGINLTNAYQNNTPCTIGFQANQSLNKVVITAGHCGSQYDSINQGGEYIGPISSKVQGGNMDAAVIPINPSSYSKYLYKNSSMDSILSVTQSTSNETVGQALTFSGSVTGTSYSTLLSKNESFTDSNTGITYTNMRKSSYNSIGGDSGGPIYNGTMIYGIHKGTFNGYKMYTHVSYIISAFGLIY